MKTIEVVAGIIQQDGKTLIAKRKSGSHLAGKWEFPGGKLEVGETPENCLKRELKEEFGIIVSIDNFTGENTCNYGDRKIRLLVYSVRHICGSFILSAHDKIRWVAPQEMSDFDFAEADLPFVRKIVEKFIG